jgi:hypothetical protein
MFHNSSIMENMVWKYVVYALITYIIIYKSIDVQSDNKPLIIFLLICSVIALDNISYFKPICMNRLEPFSSRYRANREGFSGENGKKFILPTIDNAPKYNTNNNFQTHDSNMEYKPNFYSAGGYPPDVTLENYYEPPLVQVDSKQAEYHRF